MSPLAWLRLPALLLVSSAIASAQSYSWTAFAGQPPQFGFADGIGRDARFASPSGVAVDVTGAVYVSDPLNHVIRKISAAGEVTTLAGVPGRSGATDGAPTSARFALPTGIALDRSPARGNGLFIADRINHAIRRINTNGIVSTFAGRLGTSGSADGAALSTARFNDPIAVVVDNAGLVYVTDRGNHTVRKIAIDGTVTTLAGSPGEAGGADGIGAAARFTTPGGLDVTLSGVLYIADTGNHTIRRITPEGVVTTVAGSAGLQGSTSGTGAAARFRFPHSVLADDSGLLLVSDGNNDCLRAVSPTGAVSVFSGRVDVPGDADGPLLTARYYSPAGMALGPAATVFVADSYNYSIRKISAGDVSTFAGPGGNFGRQDGEGSTALFNYPNGVAVHSSGDVYLADTRGNTIRRISPDGLVVTIAGRNTGTGIIDGDDTVSRLNYPHGLAVAPDRTVVFCEQQLHMVRVVSPDGVVSSLAGSQGQIGSADGEGVAARFNFPSGVARDSQGNLFIADTSNHTIRRIAAGTNVVTTFAGQAGASGSADGAGGAARFSFPRGVCVDAENNIIVADTNNMTIRKITPGGDVSTVAGRVLRAGTLDGPAASALFFAPSGVAVDSAGRIFVADTSSHLVRIISGNTVSTIGGVPGLAGFVEGTAGRAQFSMPNGVAVNRDGVVYVVQHGTNLVSRGVVDTKPVITRPPQPVIVPSGGAVVLAVDAAGGGLSYQWKRNGVLVSGATGSVFSIAAADASWAGSYVVEVTNSAGVTVSEPIALSLANTANVSRIVNLSILTRLERAGDSFTLGFVVGGTGATGLKPLVLRAAGPALGALGVPGTLDDPRLELFSGSTRTGENDNWGGTAELENAMSAVGAFPYREPTSRDAAATALFSSGDQSMRVSAAGAGTGIVIAEIYDATPAGTFNAATPRLVNVSVLKQLGSGLTAGFVIAGDTSKTVLIRAIGPTLGAPPINVPGVVGDPRLALYSGQVMIQRNDNWGGTAALVSTFGRIGAFSLPAASRDAVILATLAPGGYTVQVSGVNNAAGLALVEIYEVP